MSSRKSSHRQNVSVTAQTPLPRVPRRRTSWPQVGLVLVILMILIISVATFIFWFVVATSGVIYLSENALYFIRNVGLIGLMIGALGLFVAIGMFRRSALPTADLVEAIEHVCEGDYNIEVEERGPREIRALTREFNGMLNELRRRENSRRHLEVASARELLTRLEACQVNGLSGLLELQSWNQLAQLVRDWNVLVLTDSGELSLYRQPTDIGALVRNVLTERHPAASALGVTLRAAIPDPAPLANIDPTRLGEALTCLVNHALARSSSGQVVQVDVTESRKPNRLDLAVNDQGQVITSDEFPRLFTRLGVADSTRTGLELLLARELVELHGGGISAASDAEKGTTLSCVLPLD